MNETALKERLKVIAKEKGVTFNECWKQLLLERMLARVSCSSHHDHLVFKGGFLLSYLMEIGRETTDLDFLLRKIDGEESTVQKLFEEIAAIDIRDEFSFQFSKIEILSQPHMNYPGFRITLHANLGKMKDQVQVDVGIGDAVSPENREVKLFRHKGKPMFEGEIMLLTYPLETIFAEKFETSVFKGPANSRMKDYHDLLLLSRSGELDLAKLKSTIAETFKTRKTPLTHQIKFDPAEVQTLQKVWGAHLRGLEEIATTLNLPKNIEEAIDEINALLKTV